MCWVNERADPIWQVIEELWILSQIFRRSQCQRFSANLLCTVIVHSQECVQSLCVTAVWRNGKVRVWEKDPIAGQGLKEWEIQSAEKGSCREQRYKRDYPKNQCEWEHGRKNLNEEIQNTKKINTETNTKYTNNKTTQGNETWNETMRGGSGQ